jgi:N-dimethylarginine dimethylaminohydrolase
MAEPTVDAVKPNGDFMLSTSARRYLMCPPTFFDVQYAINPWMRLGERVDPARACKQWTALKATLEALGHHVEEMSPQPGLPDLVFAANGGIVIGAKAMAPAFRFSERAAETPFYADALKQRGYERVAAPHSLNEGEGDFLLVGSTILAGSGFRSDELAAAEVGAYFGLAVVSLTLADPRFYHLDTALSVLDSNTIAYLPEAFDPASRGVLRDLFPKAILAEDADARKLGLNLVSDGANVVMSAEAPGLARAVGERGYQVHPIEFDEFRKAGGGIKCCVLSLHEAPPARPHPGHTRP